jgi:thioredoxin
MKHFKLYIVAFFCILFSAEIYAEDVTYLTTEQFKTRVFDYTKNKQWKYEGETPCIIDFYTTWCGPCKRLSPILEELSEEYCGEIVIYKVDTERERELAAAFGITSIPTLLFCPVEGRPQIAKGLLPKDVLKQAIEEVLLKK